MVEIKRPYLVLLAGQLVAVHRYCDPYQKVCTGSAIVCGLVAGTSVQLPSQDNPTNASAMPMCPFPHLRIGGVSRSCFVDTGC